MNRRELLKTAVVAGLSTMIPVSVAANESKIFVLESSREHLSKKIIVTLTNGNQYGLELNPYPHLPEYKTLCGRYFPEGTPYVSWEDEMEDLSDEMTLAEDHVMETYYKYPQLVGWSIRSKWVTTIHHDRIN